jgi:hypothetical protein
VRPIAHVLGEPVIVNRFVDPGVQSALGARLTMRVNGLQMADPPAAGNVRSSG